MVSDTAVHWIIATALIVLLLLAGTNLGLVATGGSEKKPDDVFLKITELEAKLDQLAVRLASPPVVPDRWTGTDMQIWADELQSANPALKVPPARPILQGK